MKRTSERARRNLQTERKDADVRLAKIKLFYPYGVMSPFRYRIFVSVLPQCARRVDLCCRTGIDEPTDTRCRSKPYNSIERRVHFG